MRNVTSPASFLRNAVLCVSFFLMSVGPLVAARQEADIKIEVGFDGAVGRSGSIIPVAVIIDNRIASTIGTIQLTQPDSGGGSEVTQVMQFDCPAPSVKKFVLFTRVEEGRELNVNVLFKDHLKPASKKIPFPRDSSPPLILCLGVPRAYSSCPEATKYKPVNVTPRAMPDDPLALDGVHAVMVSGAAFMSLNGEQVKALRDWAATGGTMIFFDPPSDDVFHKKMAIFALGSTVNVMARGVTTLGSGLVASSGADADENASFWHADKRLGQTLFPLIDDQDHAFFRAAGLFTTLWQTQRTYGAWGFIWIFLIIVSYILVIGPVDRWLVRRTNRPYLTWFFFGGAIVLFSLVAYGYSSLVNVGTMRSVQVNIVDAAPDAGVSRGSSFFWIYSAKNATYEIGTPTDNVFFSARESDIGAGSIAGVNIANGRKSIISARIPIFSAKDFEASWYAPWQKQVKCTAKDGMVRVNIPADVKVECVYVADDTGVYTLKKTEAIEAQAGPPMTEWTATGKPLDWSSAISSSLNALNIQHQHYSRRSNRNSENESLMPSRDKLRNYLICMSFPWEQPDKTPGVSMSSFSPGEFSRLKERSPRERLLDARNRLKTGRMVILFLEPSRSLLPIDIKWNRPDREQMDMVRIQVPQEN